MKTSSLLESVLSSLGEIAVVLDRNGRIVAASVSWKLCYQASCDSSTTSGIGDTYIEVCQKVHGLDDRVLEGVVGAIASVTVGESQVESVEYLCEMSSGPQRFIVTVKALSHPVGGIIVIHDHISSASLEDIETLRARVEHFEKTLDVVPALISYVDADHRYQYTNRRYSEWFGVGATELAGRPLREVIGETAYEAVLPDLDQVFRGAEVTFERVMNYETAGERFVRGNMIPDVDDSGNVRGYFALIVDDTERYKTEERLRRSEERFAKFFNFIPMSVTISSLDDLKYTDVNENYLRMSGFSREDVIGRPGTDLGIKMPDEKVKAFLTGLARDGAVGNFETDLEFEDGRLLTVILSAVILELDGRRFLAVASNDITERKQAEVSLRELTTRLLGLQDSERRRIARELHDTTAQKISAILLSLSYIKKLLRSRTKDITSTVEEAIGLAEESLGEIRTLSYILHPPLLDQSGLQSSIRWLANGFIRRSGINVELAFSGREMRLRPELEGSVFRIVQEALTNIHRHSGSSNCIILLDQKPDEMVLEIRDEGRAILRESHDAETASISDIERLGIGIQGMRERVRQFGGELSVIVSPEGTKVTARIPLNE